MGLFLLSTDVMRFNVSYLQLYVAEKDQIKYEFNEKPWENKYVIPAISAHSKMKLWVLVEEGLRRLGNCSQGMAAEVRQGIMGRWARKLKRSRYPEMVRHQGGSQEVPADVPHRRPMWKTNPPCQSLAKSCQKACKGEKTNLVAQYQCRQGLSTPHHQSNSGKADRKVKNCQPEVLHLFRYGHNCQDKGR